MSKQVDSHPWAEVSRMTWRKRIARQRPFKAKIPAGQSYANDGPYQGSYVEHCEGGEPYDPAKQYLPKLPPLRRLAGERVCDETYSLPEVFGPSAV